LTARFGKGFSERNLLAMRDFYRAWSIPQTLSAKLTEPGASGDSLRNPRTPSAESGGSAQPFPFPLPWSHYVRLLSVSNRQARSFYETEALRGGWSVRQLDRQIATQFFERTSCHATRRPFLRQGHAPDPTDPLTPEQEIGGHEIHRQEALDDLHICSGMKVQFFCRKRAATCHGEWEQELIG
jgi:hypothetical protein